MTGTLLASPPPWPSAGLLPASVESAVPTRVELHVTGDAATISWVSTPGQTYRVQFKNQLGDGAWQDLAVNILARGEITRFENSLDRQPRRFYRVVTQP